MILILKHIFCIMETIVITLIMEKENIIKNAVAVNTLQRKAKC